MILLKHLILSSAIMNLYRTNGNIRFLYLHRNVFLPYYKGARKAYYSLSYLIKIALFEK